MRAWTQTLAGWLFIMMLSVGAVLLTPLPAAAQLAPTGGHYAAKASDTGFEGAVNSQGGYDASVPLDLPEARGGLPLPLRISYGGNKVGAAGLGWDVALSYIFVDTTIAHRRPIGSPNAAPRVRERAFLVLEGQRIDLLRSSAAARTWLARRNDAQLEVRDRGDGSMFMYDGEGRTYIFSSQGGAAGTRLVGGRLFLLNGISAPGGNSAVFIYQFNAPPLPGGGAGLAIDLLHVRYNKSPTNAGCFKNDVLISYDLPATSPLSMSMLGNTALVRVRKISKVTVFSRPSCANPDVALRTYTFNYQPDPDTRLPRLQSVTMNGQRHTPEEHVSLPVAAYTYGAATGVDGKFTYRKTKSIPFPTTSGADSTGISGSYGQVNYPRPFFLYDQRTSYFTWQSLTDINGDGRPDLTYREGPELRVLFNSPIPDGTTFTGALGQQLTGGPSNVLTHPRSLEIRSTRADRSLLQTQASADMQWRQSIDVNGDGRLDLIDAQQSPGNWVVYINTPNIDIPHHITWVRRYISIARLVHHLREAGHIVSEEYLPLAKRTTGHNTSFYTCWEWRRDPTNDVYKWVRNDAGFSGPPKNRCEVKSVGGTTIYYFGHPDRSTTEWAVRDVNGDGYPDFVYNASPIGSFVASDGPPQQDGSFEGQFLRSAYELAVDFTGSSDVKAMFNVAGTHLLGGAVDEAFSSPILFAAGAGCGVEQWRAEIYHDNDGGTTVLERESLVQVCGFDDVNGDGLADRSTFVELLTHSPIQQVTASLGTGDLNAPFSATATIRLPGPIARVYVDLAPAPDVYTGRPNACPIFSSSDIKFPIERTAGLRDLTSDGIPDYIISHNSAGTTFWTVSIGTGAGFAPPRPINLPTGFQLSLESVTCPGVVSLANTLSGLYDIDGDGRPEVIVLNDTNLDVYQLNAQQDPQHPFDGNVPSPPTEGRLIRVDNGYGAITRINYRSAKEDASTAHQVPFPEIVVSSVETIDTAGSPLLSPTRYAYGRAELIFDPAVDAFRFPGYQRVVELRITSDRVIPPPTDGVATITDSYGLAPFAPTPTMDANARFKRYLRAGRVRDVTVISGNVGADPWALLSTNIDNDARRIGGTHYEWDTRLLTAGFSDGEVCVDMVFPYDYGASRVNSLGVDQCTQRGFVFQQTALSWRGTPGTASPFNTDATVMTYSGVESVDDFGRITSVAQFNDLFRSDDNLCTQTVYATPTGTNERVLSAPVSRTTTSCGTVPLVTYSKETWEYDTSPAGVKLPPGKVSNGFVTAHTVSRLNLDTGASLGDIRLFDATYDPATGRLSTLTRSRDDGARQNHTWAYDPFGLALVSAQTEATNANGTTLPSMRTTTVRDPITLNALSATDPNGTQIGNTFDGFSRMLLSTVSPPGGTAGALSSLTYLGFAVGETGGRRIVQKVFTDPVAPASAVTAAGRSDTVFLDQLGRELRTEVALGADYANQTLVTGYRSYDKLGRVRFEADPYLSTALTSYGTTYHFNIDGTPSCFIRGHWQQPFSNVTDEASERYPTCFSRSFSNKQEVVHVREAASLLAGSPQAGVVEESIYSAIGRVMSRSTYKSNPNLVPIERATFRYDALGNLASMSRHQDPLSTTTVTTSWRYDSLGQVLELHEPDSAPQFHSYNNWGELTQLQWFDTTTNPATDRRTITRYDALGRVIHSEDRTNNLVDAATVNDYLYDQPVNLTTPPVLATNVVGRLAKATFPTGAVSFSYDGLGRVNTQTFTDTTTAPVGVYVQKHVYHGDGSLAALDLLLPDTVFKNEHVDYFYDSAGRTRSVKYSDGTINQTLFSAAGGADIDPLGRIRQAQYGLATYTASYADTGRRLLNSLKVTSPSLSSSREISYPAIRGSITAYDPLGRERSRREFRNGTAAPALVTTYDELGRLAASSLFDDDTDALSVQRQFTYDPLGNILKQDDLSSATAPGAVQLSYQTTDRDRICSIGYGMAAPGPTCNVKYDGVGNIISQPTRTNGARTLSYFANGQVKEIRDGNGNHAVFRYDAFGAVQQLVLTGNTPDTRNDQHFGGLITKRDEVVAGTRKSVLTRSIPGPGVIATRHGPTATWTFAFGEGRGNRFFTDQNGAFVQDVEYQPYGEANSTGAQPGAPTYTSAQWNGGDALVALGLSQLGARIYDPVVGRFLSRDPLIIPRTAANTNPYAFAMNNPVNGSDPSGLDTFNNIGRKLCPECDNYENIYVNGGYWPRSTEPRPAAAGGTGTYSEPPYIPPAPPPIRFTRWEKFKYWLDISDAMNRGDWDDPLVKIWTVDWEKKDFEAVESYKKWQARIETVQAPVQLLQGVNQLAGMARGPQGVAPGRIGLGGGSGNVGKGPSGIPQTPPTRMSDTAILQSHATWSNAQLALDPSLAARVLSPRSLAAAQRGSMIPARYGQSVEGLTELSIRSNPVTSRMYLRRGRPFRAEPDWVPNTPAGQNYDFVNNPNYDLFPLNPSQARIHFGRPYGRQMRAIYYLRPPNFIF